MKRIRKTWKISRPCDEKITTGRLKLRSKGWQRLKFCDGVSDWPAQQICLQTPVTGENGGSWSSARPDDDDVIMPTAYSVRKNPTGSQSSPSRKLAI